MSDRARDRGGLAVAALCFLLVLMIDFQDEWVLLAIGWGIYAFILAVR